MNMFFITTEGFKKNVMQILKTLGEDRLSAFWLRSSEDLGDTSETSAVSYMYAVCCSLESALLYVFSGHLGSQQGS